jgi:hypothetical protein
MISTERIRLTRIFGVVLLLRTQVKTSCNDQLQSIYLLSDLGNHQQGDVAANIQRGFTQRLRRFSQQRTLADCDARGVVGNFFLNLVGTFIAKWNA